MYVYCAYSATSNMQRNHACTQKDTNIERFCCIVYIGCVQRGPVFDQCPLHFAPIRQLPSEDFVRLL